MSENKYFYCYSPMLHKYLHNTCKIPYELTALHEHTKNKFWLYERNEKLNESIEQYNKIFKS
jgi:hypothetical protein